MDVDDLCPAAMMISRDLVSRDVSILNLKEWHLGLFGPRQPLRSICPGGDTSVRDVGITAFHRDVRASSPLSYSGGERTV